MEQRVPRCRSRARDLESTFDYEDLPESQYALEEQELTEKVEELRHQNDLLQNMCTLVLQKVRASSGSPLPTCPTPQAALLPQHMPNRLSTMKLYAMRE